MTMSTKKLQDIFFVANKIFYKIVFYCIFRIFNTSVRIKIFVLHDAMEKNLSVK